MTDSKTLYLTQSPFLIAMATTAILTGCTTPAHDQNAITLAQANDAPSTSSLEPIDNYASRKNRSWGAQYMTEEELNDPDRHVIPLDALESVPPYADDPALAEWKVKFESEANTFDSYDGAKLYHDSCAGCHMHEGEGAEGAGYYPPLANNSKMASKYYIADILINGFRGMPSFRSMLNDEQMAAVTQYVMQDLNSYPDVVTAEDIAQLRPIMSPRPDPSDGGGN